MKNAFLTEFAWELTSCSKGELLEFIHDRLLAWFREQSAGTAGFKVPPVAVLAKSLNVSRQSIQKVYEKLEAGKIIARNPNEREWKLLNVKKNTLKCIALLLPMAFSDYYQLTVEHGQRHFNIYCGMCDRAMESGAVLVPVPILKPNASEPEITEWIGFLRDNFIGVIHLGNRLLFPDPPLHRLCRADDIPQIGIDWENDISWGGTVSVDNENVISTVLTHLREYGHRNICLTPIFTPEKTEGEYTYHSRIFRQFLRMPHEAFGISQIQAPHRVFDDEFERELDRVISLPDPPTAFWCIDDMTAMATIRALNRRGYKVPDDFSVIGFDNLLETQNFKPPLTTLQGPRYEMGRLAVSKLCEALMHPRDFIAKNTPVPAMLYARQSTGPNRRSFVRKVLVYNRSVSV